MIDLLTPVQIYTIAIRLRKELPIRLSHRILDFMRLPYLVVCNPNMEKVYNQYVKSLDAFLECPDEIATPADEKDFAKLLEAQLQDHGNITRFLQLGHRDLSIAAQDANINSFLDKLFLTRIGNRLLAQHYLLLRQNGSNGCKDRVGSVQKECSPGEIVRRTGASLRRLCEEVYGVAPEIEVKDHGVTFAYIPDHIQFMVQELLKNALRATVERHASPLGSLLVEERHAASLPPVIVDVHKGEFGGY